MIDIDRAVCKSFPSKLSFEAKMTGFISLQLHTPNAAQGIGSADKQLARSPFRESPMPQTSQPSGLVLKNMFLQEPQKTTSIETAHRRIATALPVPESVESLKAAADVYPHVNCYPVPVVWDRAEGYQVADKYGNRWIDFSSTAVMCNTGHGHPAIRSAVEDFARTGLLAQFSFASDIRLELAQRLLELAPDSCEKVYFWTVGSEAIESAFRLAREYGIRKRPGKYHILTHSGDYHGWTLGAHQLSGKADKPWLASRDQNIHFLPFPMQIGQTDEADWAEFFDRNVSALSNEVDADDVAAIFIETLQGWGALPLPVEYMQRLRAWADEHEVLVIFDEVQTGFGRTGKWFAHEHYGVRADLICIGKGVTSTLPLAAVLGPAAVLDVLSPGEITTTHAAHPLSCVAALANLEVLEDESLIDEATRKQSIIESELASLSSRFPNHIKATSGLGMVHAIHLAGEADTANQLARDLTWECVKRGLMLFFTGRPTI